MNLMKRKWLGVMMIAAMGLLLPSPASAWNGANSASVRSKNGKYSAVLEAGSAQRPGRVTVYAAGGTSKTLWSAALADENAELGAVIADDGQSLTTAHTYYESGEGSVTGEVRLPSGSAAKLIVLLFPLADGKTKGHVPIPLQLTLAPGESAEPVRRFAFRGIKPGAYRLMVRMETPAAKGMSIARVREVSYVEVKPGEMHQPVTFDFSAVN